MNRSRKLRGGKYRLRDDAAAIEGEALRQSTSKKKSMENTASQKNRHKVEANHTACNWRAKKERTKLEGSAEDDARMRKAN